jgi:pimeloyl-ACP methyl ester carboxylesterase
MAMISVRGFQMHVEEHGTGEALLLIHGLGSSGEDWRLTIDALAQRYRVIVADVRGHGRTDKPPGEYSVPLFAADMAALCDTLGLPQVHVAGISMGGMIAFQLAIDHPSLVRSLTVLNSGPDMAPRDPRLRFALFLRKLLARTLGPQRLGKMVAKKLFPEPSQTTLREEIAARIGANDPDVYMRSLRAILGWSVEDRIGGISCPVLAIASDQDYTPVSLKEKYVAKLAHGKLAVVRNSRHAVTADQPERVVSLLTTFLDEITPARGRAAA